MKDSPVTPNAAKSISQSQSRPDSSTGAGGTARSEKEEDHADHNHALTATAASSLGFDFTEYSRVEQGAIDADDDSSSGDEVDDDDNDSMSIGSFTAGALSAAASKSHTDQPAITSFINASSLGYRTPAVNRDLFESAAMTEPPEETMMLPVHHGDENGEPVKGLDWMETSYPAWKAPVPISTEDIAAIFGRMRAMFGFQRDNMRNMFDHFMTMLDSRTSRMGPDLALATLHADYIGGENSNFKRWYFASGLASDDYKHNWPLRGDAESRSPLRKFEADDDPLMDEKKHGYESPSKVEPDCVELESMYRRRMSKLSSKAQASQVIVYLLCWGEANQIRFMPECLAFVYKCCIDCYESTIADPQYMVDARDGDFLRNIIDPLYWFYHNQLHMKDKNGVSVRREADHKDVIGYDDMNQLFWHMTGMRRIKSLDDGSIIDMQPWKRYDGLSKVVWEKTFYKTYRESRSWLHLLVNFGRIWIIHLSVFWLYTAANVPSLYTVNYQYIEDNQPPPQIRWSVIALGGAIAPLINIFATLSELLFVPRKWPHAQPLWPRLIGFGLTLAINVGPSVYIFGWTSHVDEDLLGTILAIGQLVVAIVTIIVYSVIPMGVMFRHSPRGDRVFTSCFNPLTGNDKVISYALWIGIYAAKLSESYFFLTLSLRDPVRELSVLDLDYCIGAEYIGNHLCLQQARIVLGLMLLTDLVLFFLDTYLWYIVFNTMFSVLRSLYLGASIWTPWRNVFCRLPKRVFSKVMYTRHLSRNSKSKQLVSQVWNAIVVSMYREHLIPLEQVQRLIYIQERNTETGEKMLYEPAFFVNQEDSSFPGSLFHGQLEAERRISFFAQSLSTPIPEPVPIECMPTFTVLVPHYGEKIVLSLRETIREQSPDSKISLLEYLKGLHRLEWNCFVKDSIGLSQDGELPKEFQDLETKKPEPEEEDPEKEKVSPLSRPEELPFYCVGFKSSSPEYILRTRLWASLRTQTLYRTISGFMNYPRAIKLSYSVETLESLDIKADRKSVEQALLGMARRKFRLLAAIQRMSHFTHEENQDKEMMLRAYPELDVAYLHTETDEHGDTVWYSALVDGSCDMLEDGTRKPRYKVRLSGNPILGDGKSDNQNQALIFYRGEYIQLVDANQDNYLEECLKIRSVLAEFEEMDVPPHPYAHVSTHPGGNNPPPAAPVAILGAREYIFSENIGVLGDIAAGKEQTFGTLFARTLAKIGGKLHYGHPDFLNATFMTTRGGVSKAQKGLHLNEDIYAGMNALMRGGRIKHCEYMQCGKGRDLGFGSILNFTTKIGAGMGEQMLSREYYYLGSLLPLDRFLSFYYAHAGFHINNMFIVVSLELFLVVTLNLAALAREAIVCDYDKNAPTTDVHTPPGCQNLIPVFHWVQRCVLSIFIVFFISFLPLFVQEVTERGFLRSITRLAKHFGSLSPLFEVFVCQIYAQSLNDDLSVGGARYISTGRGFATDRIPFTALYARFGSTSIYFGAKLMLILIFVSSTMWSVSLLWFWVTTVALCLAPFIFNPHQFSFMDFFMDYRNFLLWLARGNNRYTLNSWLAYQRTVRTRITGFKQHKVGDEPGPRDTITTKPGLANRLISEVLGSFVTAVTVVVPYLYVNSQSNLRGLSPTNPLLRLGVVVAGPIVLNFITLLGAFVIGATVNCCLSRKFDLPPTVLASLVHGFAVINHLLFFEVMWLLESWNFPHALLGYIATILCQSFLYRVLQTLGLSREFRTGDVNVLFWNGRWLEGHIGLHIISQPLRELLCKTIEMGMFALDFVLGHFLLFVQTPFLLIPYVDYAHTMMLLWLAPSSAYRSPMKNSYKKKRRRLVPRFLVIYFVVMILFIGAGVAPLFIPKLYKQKMVSFADSLYPGIVQPPMRSIKKLGEMINNN